MIIKNGIICDKNGEKKSDLRVENGKIESVSAQIKPREGEEVFDAEGAYILPGLT